ncbi:DUF2474 domain-containing protein [Methylobacterium soli]|uniref:DUF2474 domain-containing protein n=1 Tax=Methylobacterium soli TaxID=553447 RepID=A0A6L3T3J3_9HYPH|nr:DUF2474 domain-containing protein [Methylobacterium soli]KAB1081385.1 DUF2474 domain-containing protein [Methylobacterium soli]GJE46477.1 hypothetical protein AEGHOMDF_5682 [Methylobacterium soli]
MSAGGSAKDPPASRRGGRRLLWFVAFYALSLGAFTALVYLLRVIVRG